MKFLILLSLGLVSDLLHLFLDICTQPKHDFVNNKPVFINNTVHFCHKALERVILLLSLDLPIGKEINYWVTLSDKIVFDSEPDHQQLTLPDYLNHLDIFQRWEVCLLAIWRHFRC